MASQIPITFGSYATAPTQIVRLMLHLSRSIFRCDQSRLPRAANGAALSRSEQRYSQNGFADEFPQNIACRRHNSARLRVAEQPLDGQMLGKRSTSARPHRRRGDRDSDITCRRLALQYAQHGGVSAALHVID